MEFKDIKQGNDVWFLMEDYDDEEEEEMDEDEMSIGVFKGKVKEISAGLVFIEGNDDADEMFLFNDECFPSMESAVAEVSKMFTDGE